MVGIALEIAVVLLDGLLFGHGLKAGDGVVGRAGCFDSLLGRG